MKFQNLSVKRLFGRVAMGLVLSMSGITIALFFVTKQTAVLLTGGTLLLCALVGIFVLTQVFGKRLSQFTADLCQTLDHMIAGNEAPQRPEDSGKLRQPLSKNLRQYKNPHKGAQQQRPACQQHRNLFCHKKQGYGDPGHGEDKLHCHPAKQPLYREVLKLHFTSPPVH